MNLLPKALGTRPRLAVEIKPEGVVAACAEDAAAVLTAVSLASFAPGALAPGLRVGNVANRSAVVAAVKKALEAVTLRERETSVIIPDTAVRVLLLDFDSLPAKPAEALPVVRFRLKKLLPFDAEDAVVSYQIMSTARNLVRVLAVAIPKDVLSEYEGIVRDAGFEPGAVLPSTMATLSGLEENEAPALVVNVDESAVTTAIVQGSVLLLHRTVDFAAEGDVPSHERPPDSGTEIEAPMTVAARDVTQAVNVAVAYFEDTLQSIPGQMLSAGTMGAKLLRDLLEEYGGGMAEPIDVHEMVDPSMLAAGASSSRAPQGWLAGVRGALRN